MYYFKHKIISPNSTNLNIYNFTFRCPKPLFSAVQSNKLITFLGNNFKTVLKMD